MRNTLSHGLYILVLTGLVSSSALAFKDLGVDFGASTISRGLSKISQNTSGEDRNFLGTMYYSLVLGTSFDLSGDWHLAPDVTYTPWSRQSPDGGSSETLWTGALPVVYNLSGADSGFDVEAGPVLMYYTLQGKGGTAVLNNGNGTSTFVLPGTWQTSKTLALQTGAGYSFGANKINLDLITEALLSNSRRQYDLMLTYTYNLLEN
jgi:hypothetical protein